MEHSVAAKRSKACSRLDQDVANAGASAQSSQLSVGRLTYQDRLNSAPKRHSHSRDPARKIYALTTIGACCHIMTQSRFSVMGLAAWKICKRITYIGNQLPKNTVIGGIFGEMVWRWCLRMQKLEGTYHGEVDACKSELRDTSQSTWLVGGLTLVPSVLQN